MYGEYDFGRRDELDELLDRYGDADPLILDLSEVERFDSGALRSLIRFQRARKEAGRTPPVLYRPRRTVRDFLEVANVMDTFVINDDGV